MRYMVSHGLDIGFPAVLDAVHWVVGGCDEHLGGRDVVPTLDFLVSEVGMPVSAQVCAVLDLQRPTGRPTGRPTDRPTDRPIDRPGPNATLLVANILMREFLDYRLTQHN